MLKMITMAPELEGADAAANRARAAGVVVAMGHSDASYSIACSAIESGTRYAVHTFNAMRGFTHRDSGIVGAVLADDRVFAEIIADGIHVHPEVIKVFTDAISATDMPDGQYLLGQHAVTVTNGVCRDAEGRLAGSTLTQEVALKNFVEWSGMRMDDAVFSLT
jgi:N-acetylglucosamine-6-phosphate deacetylase